MFTSMKFTVNEFCEGPRMPICKVKKLCINSMWIALLIHILLLTWLLIACVLQLIGYSPDWHFKGKTIKSFNKILDDSGSVYYRWLLWHCDSRGLHCPHSETSCRRSVEVDTAASGTVHTRGHSQQGHKGQASMWPGELTVQSTDSHTETVWCGLSRGPARG